MTRKQYIIPKIVITQMQSAISFMSESFTPSSEENGEAEGKMYDEWDDDYE